MEQRELKSGEQAENIILEFKPRERQDMLVPCVWDRWEQGGEVLNSFALITDEPPPEIASAGHDRCPINLTIEAAHAWLVPHQTRAEYFAILGERQKPYYEHQVTVAA